MNKKYILKNRRRFFTFIMLLIIILTCTFLAGTVNGTDTSENYITVTVEYGDTLWDIAREYNPEGDIRQYIHRIEKFNNITDSTIYAGEILRLPS